MRFEGGGVGTPLAAYYISGMTAPTAQGVTEMSEVIEFTLVLVRENLMTLVVTQVLDFSLEL